MQKKILVVAACVLFAAGVGRELLGQSLADIARREEARRKTVRNPAKVLTNKDLGPPPVVTATSTGAPQTAQEAESAQAGDGKAPDKEPPKDRTYWAGRQKALQDQLDQDQAFAAALQSQINALSADFIARDDPAQRVAIERNRQKAIGDLGRLRDAIVKDQKAISDLGEEARRAGVPPGWLR
jgi:hypothetical protein